MNFFIFFFNDTATTEIYTLSLHDALPILVGAVDGPGFHYPFPVAQHAVHPPVNEQPELRVLEPSARLEVFLRRRISLLRARRRRTGQHRAKDRRAAHRS